MKINKLLSDRLEACYSVCRLQNQDYDFLLVASEVDQACFAWISGNPLYIGVTVVIYLAFLFLLRTHRESIYAYLKTMADKNSGYEGSCEKIFIAED